MFSGVSGCVNTYTHTHIHTFMSYGINIVDTIEISTEILNDEVMV